MKKNYESITAAYAAANPEDGLQRRAHVIARRRAIERGQVYPSKHDMAQARKEAKK